MFKFLKNESNDEGYSHKFVRQMFAIGREICPSIGKAVQMSTGNQDVFPVNDDASLEISLAILGTALAVLKGHSKVMTVDRGKRVETFCKRSIQKDYDLPSDTVAEFNQALDEYQDAFERSMTERNNPFGEISGMMLVRCLGPEVLTLCIPGTSNLKPLTHEMVGDLMTMTVTQALKYWEDK